MGFSDLKTRTKILIGICSPLILLPVLGAVSVYGTNTILETNRWVDFTHKVLGDTAAVVASAVDMETGMRGYLLAGREGFLDPYRQGEEATYKRIAELQQAVSHHPTQVERLVEVEKILREWQEQVTEPTIELRRKIGDAETMNDMARLVGEAPLKAFFDKFRGQIRTFIDREAALLKKRRDDFHVAEKRVHEDLELIGETVGWVDHTHEILAAAARLLAHAVDMETGERGFLLTGEDDFLEPYKNGQSAFFEEMGALQKKVADNQAQVKRLEEMEGIIRAWISEVTEPAIALRRQVNGGDKPLADIDALVSRRTGKKYFDAFRELIAAFSKTETDLMAGRRKAAVAAERKAAESLDDMDEGEEWVAHTYEVIMHANSILASAVDMETGMRGYLLAGREDFLAPYEAGRKKFFDLGKSLGKTVSDNPPQVELLGEIGKTIQGWQADVVEPMVTLRRKIGHAKTMDDMADLIGEARGKQYFDGFRALMTDFRAEEEVLMKQRQEGNEATINFTYVIIAGCIVAGIAIGVGLAWLLGGGIIRPIQEAVNSLASTSNEMAATATQQEKTSAQQSAAVNETTSTVEELDVSSKRIAEQSGAAAGQAEKGVSQAENGRAMAEELRTAMSEIVAKSEAIGREILQLGEQTGEIGSINEAVTDIANQTNLLALNAAVEAARAGEHGQGFAVVAQEIRKLAEQSKKSAERIGRLVREIQDVTNRAVMASENGSKAAEEGARKVTETGQTFETVAAAIGAISEVVNQIATNAREQSNATKQVTEAMNSINTGIREMTAGMSQTRTGVQNLDAVATNLKSMM